jgi:hypothetical protein
MISLCFIQLLPSQSRVTLRLTLTLTLTLLTAPNVPQTSSILSPVAPYSPISCPTLRQVPPLSRFTVRYDITYLTASKLSSLSSLRLESESLLQAAAISGGDLKGGKKVKLHLAQDDAIQRIGGPGSVKDPGPDMTGRVESTGDLGGQGRDVTEETREEESRIRGQDSSAEMVASDEGTRSGSRRSLKRIRYEEDDESDSSQGEDGDSISPFHPSSSSSSSSSSRLQFPTRPLASDPSRVTDRWISIDTSSFAASYCGLQAMILVSQLA